MGSQNTFFVTTNIANELGASSVSKLENEQTRIDSVWLSDLRDMGKCNARVGQLQLFKRSSRISGLTSRRDPQGLHHDTVAVWCAQTFERSWRPDRAARWRSSAA